MTRRRWLIAVRASVGVRARRRVAWKVDFRSSMIVEVARGVVGGAALCEDDEVMNDSREDCILYQEGLTECGKNLARTRMSSVATETPNARVTSFFQHVYGSFSLFLIGLSSSFL